MTIQNGVGYFNTGGPGSSIPGSNELWTFNSYTGVHSLVGSLASTITGVGMCGLTAVGNPASATSRNAGSNPASYTAVTLPILGTTYTGSVDLGGTTGHNLAWLVGYSTPATVTFGGGQTLLVNVVDPNGELLAQPFVAGPVATFDIPIPADTSLFGIQASTQALHVGGVTPYALSNAQDLLLGYQLRAGRASSA